MCVCLLLAKASKRELKNQQPEFIASTTELPPPNEYLVGFSRNYDRCRVVEGQPRVDGESQMEKGSSVIVCRTNRGRVSETSGVGNHHLWVCSSWLSLTCSSAKIRFAGDAGSDVRSILAALMLITSTSMARGRRVTAFSCVLIGSVYRECSRCGSWRCLHDGCAGSLVRQEMCWHMQP